MIKRADWRDDVVAALATPCESSWRGIVRIGNRLAKREGPLAVVDRAYFQRLLADRLTTWPPELARKVPPTWPPEWRTLAELRVREIDTYGRYIVGVGADPRLRRKDGGQAVHLRRRFVGGARTFDGRALMKLGDVGEPDLRGWMTLDLSWGPLAVEVAVEVKEPGGRLDPDQEKWRDAALLAGVTYCCVTTVEEAVLFLVETRRRLISQLKGVP